MVPLLKEAGVTDPVAFMFDAMNASLSGIIIYTAVRKDVSDDLAGPIIDFRFMAVNRAAMQLLNLTENPQGNTMLTLFPGTQEHGFFEQYVQVVETGQPMRFETEYNADGVSGWYDVVVVKLYDGFVITFNDITTQKNAIQQIAQQNSLLNGVMDTSRNGIASIRAVRNASGVITDFRLETFNNALAASSGFTADEIRNQSIATIDPDVHTSGLFDQYVAVCETGQIQEVEYHYPKTGHWFSVAAARQETDRVVVTVTDITETKQTLLTLERQARHADVLVEELQKSNANLEQFAYIASHDLQEPLRKIQSFGDILIDQYAPNLGETGSDIIRRMQAASARMHSLIRDLLAYSRVASRTDAFKRVDLNSILHDVLTDLEATLHEKNGTIEADRLPTLTGEPLQLRQLFQNLLSNALKFTKPNLPPFIRITCEIKQSQALQTLAPTLTSGDYCCIVISDNGIGFDAQYSERIFQLFHRLHTRSAFAGTGIGLSIVKKVVDNHNGFIKADGFPGEGATFTVLLPTNT
ncbi:sensor histidine kinase [Spirosoma montaniterrae]|uniref:histidine kinase n=1 Tax=Spirosoma montaniterrae TaxID=1178516 RepID=A0A1P9WTB0_9BACT|nr:ATP-binding protein [Spirosoma montaniterrae]AQG78580.1 hypothetical protein AWR27_04015 [Spirosoma montaniterrae]